MKKITAFITLIMMFLQNAAYPAFFLAPAGIVETDRFLLNLAKKGPITLKTNNSFLSEYGTSKKELEDIVNNRRDVLKKARIPHYEEIIAYINQKINELEKRLPEAQPGSWEQEHLPGLLVSAHESVKRLQELYSAGSIYVFEPIINGTWDYAFAYGCDQEIGIASFMLNEKKEVLAELLFITNIYYKLEESKIYNLRRRLFKENYPDGKNTIYHIVRTMALSALQKWDGINHIDMLKNMLQGINNAKVFFVDGGVSEGKGEDYLYRYIWDVSLDNKQYAVRLLTGRYDALFCLSSIVLDKKYSINPDLIMTDIRSTDAISSIQADYNKLPWFVAGLNKQEGVMGVKNIPREINDIIKKELAQKDTVFLCDMPFLCALIKYFTINKTHTEIILKNILNNTKPFIPQSIFNEMIDAVIVEEQLPYQLRYAAETNLYFVSNIFSALDKESKKILLKEYLLTTGHKPNQITKILRNLFADYLDILFAVFVDSSNTPNDVIHIKRFLCDDTIIYYNSNIVEYLAQYLNNKNYNIVSKVLDIFLRVVVKKDDTWELINLLKDTVFQKEIASSFMLSYLTFYGYEIVNLDKHGDEDDEAGYNEVIDLFNSRAESIYFYLLKLEEERKKSGRFNVLIDGRIIDFSKLLDNNAQVPGREGRSWYTELRDRIHRQPMPSDRQYVKNVIYYWKDLDKAEIKEPYIGLSQELKEEFGSILKTYSDIINCFVQNLYKKKKITTGDKDIFLDEILKLREEEMIEILYNSAENTAIHRGNSIFTKIEYMLRLYYALSERYTTVEGTMADETHKLLKKVSGEGCLKNQCENLVKALTTQDTFAILRELVALRLEIKKILLSRNPDSVQSIDERRLIQNLLNLDYNLFYYGKNSINILSETILHAKNIEEIKQQMPVLILIARFLQASGLGGVEFEQFVDELQCGDITISQLENLVRALSIETHKMKRKINEDLRAGMTYIFDDYKIPNLTNEWRECAEIKPEWVQIDGEERAVDVLTEESKEEMRTVFIDGIIRDNGLLIFQDVLNHCNTVINNAPKESVVTRVKPSVMTEHVLEDQFFRFGHEDVIPRTPLLSLWSKKGLNLVTMTKNNMPVPPGVIVSAKLVTRPDIYMSDTFKELLQKEIALIQKHVKYPDLKLLLYARSGSAFMLPGLMATIPNIGMNDQEAEALAQSSGDRWFAYDTYAEFIRSYGIHVLGIKETYFQEVFDIYTKDSVSGDEMAAVCTKYKKVIKRYGKGETIPETMIDQIIRAVDAVYKSWDSPEAVAERARTDISQDWGTVVILQKGVFGNLNPTQDGKISGAGAGVLRMREDGACIVKGKFRFRSIGDQVMSRAEHNYVLLSKTQKVSPHTQTLEELQPELYRRIMHYALQLKELFRNNQHFEFVIERNDIWLTQTNDDAVVDAFPEFIDAIEQEPICRGYAAAGGAVRGWACSSFEEAEKLLKKYAEEKPADIDGVILLIERVGPELISRIPKGVHILAKIMSVHAETLAQNNGITAVCAEDAMTYNTQEARWHIGNNPIPFGTVLSIDGHENQLVYHHSGCVYLGSIPLKDKTLAQKTELIMPQASPSDVSY